MWAPTQHEAQCKYPRHCQWGHGAHRGTGTACAVWQGGGADNGFMDAMSSIERLVQVSGQHHHRAEGLQQALRDANDLMPGPDQPDQSSRSLMPLCPPLPLPRLMSD